MMNQMMSTSLFSTQWIKYDEYQLLADEQGSWYVTPAKDSRYTLYDPFLVKQMLLTDLMQLGQLGLKEEGFTDALRTGVLNFVCQYGLLGFLTESVYNYHIIGEAYVLPIRGNVLGLTQMGDGEQYWRQFVPFADAEDIVVNCYKDSYYIRKAEDSPSFFGKRPAALDIVFSKFYSEQVAWIMTFAKTMVKHYKTVQVYQQHSQDLTEPVSIMGDQFHPEKLGFEITCGQNKAIAWQFNGLKSAIEMMYGFIIAEAQPLLITCPYCGRIFMATNKKEKYCSLSCRNCINVINSRKRKEEKQGMNEMANNKVNRQKLLQQFQEYQAPMGLYMIKNQHNGRYFLGEAKNIPGKLNSARFQLQMGGHFIKQLQEEWNTYGEQAFTFTIVEQLEYLENEPSKDYTEELAMLKALWLERQSAEDQALRYLK